MRISYSSLETFKVCPAKYKFSVIDKIKMPKSKEAIFGTLIHDALKMLHQPSHPTPPTEEYLLNYFNQKWDPSVYANPAEETAFLHQGVKILKDYYIKNHPSKFNIVDLETRFGAPIATDSEIHQITGQIDRIDKLDDGTFEIIDYKTTKKMPSQQTVDDNLQLSIYHLGVINRWPSLEQKPIKFSLYFLKHGEKLSTIKTVESLPITKDKIITTISQIETCQKNNKFDPQPNPLCDWCEYQRQCPFFKHKFRNEQPQIDGNQINQLVNEYLDLKIKSDEVTKKMTEIKMALNTYCDQQQLERLFGDKGYISRQLQQRFTYNNELVRQILEPLDKWLEIVNIDSAKLKKTIKFLPLEIKDKIEQAKKLSKEFKTITVKFTTN